MRILRLFLFFTVLLVTGHANSTNIIDGELGSANCNEVYNAWHGAGVSTIPAADSLYNILDIPNWVTDQNGDPVASADLLEETDDLMAFTDLISWITRIQAITPFQAQIFIPSGVYVIGDQLILYSNISLKGDGSDSTILEFQIKDTETNTVNSTHFNKNAIEIVGSSNARISNVGIEDLTIKRCYGEIDLTHPNMSDFISDAQNAVLGVLPLMDSEAIVTLLDWYFHDTPTNIFQRNNIYIENATDCWITGVESAKTNRHHVMIMGSKRLTEFDDPVFTDKISITGCYFHDAANHGRLGFGYGVEIFDNCQKILVENNIYRNLRHGIVVSDRSRLNVIGYNFILDPHITENTFLYGSEYTGDIVFHGQPSNNTYGDGTDESYGPSYNLTEGNSCRAIWVDSYHGKNGRNNTFLRNRVNDIGMHTYGPWAMESIFYSLADSEIHWPGGFCQPRQLIVNNYMKCTHWFLSNFYAFPRRLKGDPQFEKSTKQRAINFWGRVFNSNKEWDSDVWDSNYSYYKVNRPDFFPVFSNWPLNPKDEFNPAQLRWEASGKLTVGRDDPVGYAGIHHYTSDVTFSDSFTVDEGEALIIGKGVTVSIAPGKKIIIKGTLIALGNEIQPISFVCSDSTQSWKGIEVYSSNDARKPNVTLSYCTIKQSSGRALSMQDYNRAMIENCQIEQNSGGGIFSENGNLQLHTSIIRMNTVSNASNHHGAGLSLSNTNAEIVSTLFSSNRTYLTGGGAIHITGTPADTSMVDLYNCYFTGNTGQLSPPTNGYAIHAEGLNSVLSLYNCSFVEQGNALKSSLENDVVLVNCLFWNSASDNHQITSDNISSTHEYKLSHCYLPNYEQNIIQSIATIVDTVFTGQFGAVYPNNTGFIVPNRSSMLLNAGNAAILEETDIRGYVDAMGNPRVCGVGIDVGAIEIMKPELTINDTSIDFGMVDVFCVADSTIRIENIGTEDLDLYSISLPTGYTVDQAFPLTVPTGYSASGADSLDSYINLKVSFSPVHHQSDYLNKSITIATNDSLYQSVVIQVSGIGSAAELSMSDSTLVLADFPANNTPSLGREFVIFKNTGNAELVIDSLLVTTDFQVAISDSLDQELKSTVLAPIERNRGSERSRGTPTRQTSSSISLASVDTKPNQSRSSSPRSLDYVKNLTWYGLGQMQQLSIAPGDSIFVHARYIPYLITGYCGTITLTSNDPYAPDRTIELSGQGIPLVVTNNPSEIEVSSVISADTLWTCPQIEIKSNVEVGALSRLTIRPYKAEIAVKADSTSMFRVYGELHARRSSNQQFSVTFAGVDSLSGWKGIAFLNNAAGISRLDSVYVYNANDYNRTEEGGGAIHSQGYHSLLLNNSVFQGNSSDFDGGSIYLSNGTILIDNSVFDNNIAVRGGSIATDGLGSELVIENTEFNNNQAVQSGGAIYSSDALVTVSESNFISNIAVNGGALSVSGDQSNVTISSSVFEQNGDLNGTGGAVYLAGGQLTIDAGTDFSLNTANIGGAIAVVGSTASMNVVNTTFCQNIALASGGAIMSLEGNLEVENSSFTNCSSQDSGGALALFDSNYAITRNNFTNCLAASANGKGGAIYIQNPVSKADRGSTKLLTEQRILRSNEIRQSSAIAGGAIYQDGSGSIVSNAVVQNHASIGAGLYLKNSVGRFDNNTIADNIASGMGGAIVCDSLGIVIKNTIIWGNSQSSGNSIHCLNGQIIDLVNCAIEDTLQITSGSLQGTSTQNCLTDDPAFDSESPTPYQLTNTSLCVNGGTRDSNLDGVDALGNPRINVSNGTPIIDIGAYEFMGPYWVCTRDTIPDYVEITYSPTHFDNDLYITNTGTLHLDPGVSFLAQNNSMIKVNGSVDARGTETAGISFSSALGNPSWYGFSFEGGLSAGSSTFQHCSFSNGKAYSGTIHTGHDASNGGVMYINGYPAIQIDNCSFSNNQASDSGGAIYVTNIVLQDSILITNSEFTSNKVKEGSGGAVCSYDSKLHLQDNQFSLNTAGYPLDTSFTPEVNGTCGGAISLINSQTSSIEHAIIDNQFHANSAAGSGGGIYANAGLQSIIDNQFYESIALGSDKSGIRSMAYGGGAISVVGGAIAVINQNTFDSNYAYAGGAIHNHDSVSNVADNEFNGNKAQFGGAIQLISIDSPNNLARNMFNANGTADSTNCFIGGAVRMQDCESNVEINLSKFIANSCNDKGGAIAIQNSNGLILVNNQISSNSAVNGGGIFLDDSEISFSNNTLAHNVGTSSGGGVYIDGSRMESTNNLHWSNMAPIGFEVRLLGGATMPVYNGFIRQTPSAVECQTGSMISFTDCQGDIDQPPLLINDSHNYNLKPDSPCVNSGDVNVYHTLTDLNLRNRIVGGTIDIGAYEYSGTTIEGSPVDSLTIWDDTCITIISPIVISDGKKLVIDDNVSVFFEENGSLYVENSTLEARNNVSFISETLIPGYHITLKDSAPVSLLGTSALGVKLKTETTFLSVENSIFNNSFLFHNNQSLGVRNSEFSASNLDAVNTSITNDTLMVSIVGSYFHDKPDSTAISIYSYPGFIITDNTISNYYTGISLFESGQGKYFSLGGNNIEGNQYGYGIQAYHSNIEMNSSGSVKNNYIGLGGLRNSSLYIAGNKEPPYQSFNNNYSDEMAFTHDSFPKDIRHNLIYDSLHPSDALLRCTNCTESGQHDVSYNYWYLSDPLGLISPSERFSCDPIWDMDASMVPEIAADQDLFELAKYNLRIGHNDLAVIQFKDLIENYPDTQYKEEAAKLLMAAGGSSSAAIYDLQHFYATEPNLHNEIGIEKLADYLVNYCNLKLEDYQAVIDWYEDIILNPPSVADSIYAVIDLGYTYLLMNAADDRAQFVGKYTQYIPKSLQTFRRNLDGYINQLLHSTPSSSNVPPVPISFVLHQNYPNPFNPTTTIAFEIPEDAPAQLAIYNIRGQLVKEIRYESLTKGYHRLVWDGRDRNNRSVGSGVYFYRMTYKGRAITKKMCIVK